MADVSTPSPMDENLALLTLDDEPAGQGEEPPEPQPASGGDLLPFPAGLRESILRFLDKEL